jgi:hypothetical protein
VAASLFDAHSSLVDIWAYGYAASGGRLTLPDALPETRWTNDGCVDVRTHELTGPDAVRDAVMTALRRVDYTHFARNFLMSQGIELRD